MSDVPDEGARAAEHDATGEHSARGTFILLIAYLVIIVGLWGTLYLTLLSRG